MDIEQTLIEWIETRDEHEFDASIAEETELFHSGILDSMGFVGLIAYAEELSGKSIDFDAVDPTTLVSVRSVVQSLS